MYEKYDVISSCIHSVVMVALLPRILSIKSSYNDLQTIWNYWQAESTLSIELNAHVPQLTEAENSFRSFETKIRDLHLDEKEFALLLLMIITRTSPTKKSFVNKIIIAFNLDINVMNEETKFWPKCQYECVQAFSEYTQGEHTLNSLIERVISLF